MSHFKVICYVIICYFYFILFQSGKSKMGHPVFYYIARRYKTDEIREDLLMYYVLLAIKPFNARKFEIIIDLTHVGPHNR